MIPFDQFKAAADAIPYQYRHAPFLGALVKWLWPQIVVEVGTHLGMSAVWMARGLQENFTSPDTLTRGELYCIDPFCWRDQPNQEADWNRNIDACGVRDVTRLLKGRSEEVEWPGRVDMAYIDGNHTSKVCWHDCMKAVELGATCLCLNDTSTCEGVQQVADQHLHSLGQAERGGGGWGIIEVPFDAGLLVAVKRSSPRPKPTQGDYDQWDKP